MNIIRKKLIKIYDYSQVKDGILPKLYDITGEALMPNQVDNKLYRNLFNIKNIVMDKHANNVTVTLYLDNPDNYQITDVAVEFADVEIKRNASQDGISVLEFIMTPQLYLDSYRLSYATSQISGNTTRNLTFLFSGLGLCATVGV